MSRPLHRLTGVLGWVAVALIGLGVVIALVPVSNPGVQRCGAPILYLVSGELDRIPDESGRIARDGAVVTLSPAARERAIESPCSERVERRAIPAGVLVVAGAMVGLTAVTIGIVGAWRRTARKTRPDTEPEMSEVP